MIHPKSSMLLARVGRQALWLSQQRQSRDSIVAATSSCLIGPSHSNASGSYRLYATKNGGSSSNNNLKKSAMKRQMERHPAEAVHVSPALSSTNQKDEGLSSTASSSSSSALSTSSTFTATLNDTDPVFPSSRITPSSIPIQAIPADFNAAWETDKPYLLSSLTDQADHPLFDKGELFDPNIHLQYAPKDWRGYEPATPLSDFLMQRIGVAGRPITTAEYMSHALTHPRFGYYTNPPKSSLEKKSLPGNGWGNRDGDEDDFDANDWDEEDKSKSQNASTLIGPRGDFVTAPEVSHVFGHCICIWFVTQWKSRILNSPKKVQLVELGPGRGTLMTDILQLAISSKLQDFGQAIQEVHFIEASRELRSQQEQALRDGLGQLIDFEFVHMQRLLPSSVDATEQTTETSTAAAESSSSSSSATTTSSTTTTNTKEKKMFQIKIHWHDTFSSFQGQRNKDLPIFMVLQEFLDALPVHSFKKTSEGWRERLIDVVSVEDEDGEGDAAAPSATAAGSSNSQQDPPKPRLLPRLRQVLAPEATPAVELFLTPNRQYDSAPEGSVVEICPEAVVLVQDISKLLEENRGVSLIIDYGQDGTTDTLRAFSNHRQVPLTSYPGQVDVTADVDFFALRNSVAVGNNKKENKEISQDRKIHAFGPITQGEFLMRMGAADIVINSIEQEDTSAEHAQNLADALKYLVLPEHMGERYKVLALAPKLDGIFAPAGMET